MRFGRDRVEAAAVVAGLLAMALYCRVHFAVTTDIARFLPEGSDLRLANLTRALAESELTRTMILSVAAPDVHAAATAAGELGDALRTDPRVAWVRDSPAVDPHGVAAVHDLYFPRRLMILSDRPEELAGRLDDDGLARAAQELKRRLAGPAGPLLARIGAEDPLLGFASQLDRLASIQNGTPGTVDGHFVSADGHGMVFLGTRESAFQSTEQALLLDAIDSDFARISGSHAGLVLEESGVNRFAVAAERSIKEDIRRISFFSTLGGILLLLLFFRSPGYVALLMIPVGAGMLAGLTVCLLVFGTIHGMSLAFGSALIGVCIDYPIHFFNNYTLRPDAGGALGSLRRIWMGVFLGAITSVAGFAGMAWTALPGIREIAIFAPAGIIAALVVTRYLLPPLMPPCQTPTRFQTMAVEAIGKTLAGMRKRRRALALLPVCALALCAVGLPRIHWVDDLTALNRLDPAMVEEDSRVRDRVSPLDSGRFVAAVGGDEEAALVANDAAFTQLESAQREGLLTDFRSIHAVLWSTTLQRANLQAVLAAPDLAARAERAFEGQGFKPGALLPFGEFLRSPPPLPMTWADVLSTPLGEAVRPFRIAIPPHGEVGILTLLEGVRDPAALEARLQGLKGVTWFNQAEFLGEVYRRFRARTFQLIAAGLVAVFAIVWLRYRAVRPSLSAFLPSVAAATTATAILALVGIEQNLLNVMGMLLVLSMGVDYGIFLVEAQRRQDALAMNMLSVVIACLATLLSFGLMGLSRNPALRSIGLTTGLGCFLSLVFTPATLFLFESRRP